MRLQIPKPLGPDEDMALVDRMRQGDMTARAALIEGNLRTVERVTRKFMGIGVAAEDRLSIGILALIYAVDRYDPARGIPLKAYIRLTVKCKMMNTNRDGRPDRENVVASLDAPARTRSGEPGEATLHNYLASPGLSALDRMVAVELRLRMRAAVNRLPEPMRRVIWLRYGGWRVLTKKEVAAILGCAEMTVVRYEREALRQCRRAIQAGRLWAGKEQKRGHGDAAGG